MAALSPAMRPLPDLKPAPVILFVTSTWIGDAVLSTGVLRHVLERYDRPRLTIAVGTPSASLFRCVPGLERLIGVTKRPYALHWLDLLRQIGPQKWDLAFDLRRSLITWFLRTQHRYIVGKGVPDVPRVMELGTMLGVSPPPRPQLWWSAAHEAAARQMIPAEGPVLAIGPISNWAGKQWPLDRFVELVARLTAPGATLAHAPVAVFAAARERELVRPLIASLPRDRCFEVIGEPDLLTVAAALRRTSLFIGNDSGLMHMAAAVDIPTLGLFGPTSAARYRPWGPLAEAAVALPPESEGIPSLDVRAKASLMDGLSVDKVEEMAVSLMRRIAESSLANDQQARHSPAKRPAVISSK